MCVGVCVCVCIYTHTYAYIFPKNENTQALAALRTNRNYPRLDSDLSLLKIQSSVLPTFG